MNQNTRILELEITQEDIVEAVKQSRKGENISESCVVSVAARRQGVSNFTASASGYLNVSVGDTEWYSPEAEEVMNQFDQNFRRNDNPVKPCKLIFEERLKGKCSF